MLLSSMSRWLTDLLHSLFDFQLNLPEGVSVDVVVSSIVDTGHLFVQQPTHPSFPSLERLNQFMNSCYLQDGIVPQLPRPIEGTYVHSASVHFLEKVFAKVYFSYRTIGLVTFNILLDRIRIYQTTLFWCEINKHFSQSFHQTIGLVSWLYLPDRLFILPEMSGGLVTFRISVVIIFANLQPSIYSWDFWLSISCFIMLTHEEILA